MIADAINKQKNEANRGQEEVMKLLDRIVEEIEKCPEGRQSTLNGELSLHFNHYEGLKVRLCDT